MSEITYKYYPDVPGSNKIEQYLNLLYLGQKYKRCKQYDIADDIYNTIIQNFGETGVLDVAIAKNLASRGDYDQAIEYFQRALDSYNISENILREEGYDATISNHLKILKNRDKISHDKFLKYLTGISGDKDYACVDEKNYSKSIVIFIDLLGTKESENNFKKLFSANMIFRNKVQKIENIGKEIFTRKVFAFSDCCFIIFKQKYKDEDIFEENVVKEILISFSKVCIELLKEKIFFRGGIAYGDIWNDMEGMFGPAANEAYLLESKFSNYIRIGINKEIAELVYKNTDTIVLYDEKEKLYYLNIFYLTGQGQIYVNENKCGEYLENIHTHVKEVMKEYKKKIRDIIENKENIPLESISLLEKYGHILQKYLWFNNYLQERKKYKKI